MSSDLSQNSKYTIISGAKDITLFWHDYMDQPGINAWFYRQHLWWFGGHRAVERLSYMSIDQEGQDRTNSSVRTITR